MLWVSIVNMVEDWLLMYRWLRENGSVVEGNGGTSSGPVKFIQKFEKTVSAYDQGGHRPGMNCIYYDWFNYHSPEITMLKDAGGKDDDRARKLKYAIKWSRLFTDRILEDEDIALFSPKDAKKLLTLYRDEFNKKYIEYEKDPNIRKRFIKAKELAFTHAKVRAETGNNYLYFRDNVDEQRMGKDKVHNSNLCTEIYLPNKPFKVSKEKFST